MKAYTTSAGTKIGSATLSDMKSDLKAGNDWQQVINDHLVDVLPDDSDDYDRMDDAMEVLRHVEGTIPSLCW